MTIGLTLLLSTFAPACTSDSSDEVTALQAAAEEAAQELNRSLRPRYGAIRDAIRDRMKPSGVQEEEWSVQVRGLITAHARSDAVAPRIAIAHDIESHLRQLETRFVDFDGAEQVREAALFDASSVRDAAATYNRARDAIERFVQEQTRRGSQPATEEQRLLAYGEFEPWMPARTSVERYGVSDALTRSFFTVSTAGEAYKVSRGPYSYAFDPRIGVLYTDDMSVSGQSVASAPSDTDYDARLEIMREMLDHATRASRGTPDGAGIARIRDRFVSESNVRRPMQK